MITFNYSVDVELKNHVLDVVIESYDNLSDIDFDELHNECFNTNYYIVGYGQASAWLKKHQIDAFDAISYILESEIEHFGESYLKPDDINSEKVVNLLVYFYSQECIDFYELSHCETIDDIKEVLDI